MANIKEVIDSMTYHTPNEEILRIMNLVRDEFHELAMNIDTFLVPSRQRSLAFTALEEALTWTMKGLSVQQQD